jgi:hypothetical protein
MWVLTYPHLTSMELSYEEIDLLISKIAVGKSLIRTNNEFIYLHHPSNELKMKAKLIYDDAYQQALSEGLLPKKDLEDIILARGIFGDDDAAAVAKLQSRLEGQEVVLAKTLKVKANQDRIKKVIAEIKEEMSALLFKKYSKLYMSAETKAEEEVTSYNCYECTYASSGEKYWSTYEDFIQDRDDKFKNNVFSNYVTLIRGIDISKIRFIARSTLWRIRYNNSMKTSETLLGIPTIDYSVDQLNLVYWANYYDQIYSMMPTDRPSDETINDDELLDKFMEEYYNEMNNETSIQKERKIKTKGLLSAFDSDEVIVTQSNELYHDIKYDKPKEAQKLKDRTDIKKRASTQSARKKQEITKHGVAKKV